MDERLNNAVDLLSDSGIEKPMQGLAEIEEIISGLKDEEYIHAIDAVMGLFYIDPYEMPEFEPLVNKASQFLAAQGERVIDRLVEMLTGSDMKFEFNIARTLGLMGARAVGKLIQAYENTDDTLVRSFVVFAIGKIKDPVVADAIPLLLQAAVDSNREIRDSAVRSIGKLVEVVRVEQISGHDRDHIVEALTKNVGDRVAAIRAKSVRSLGKMAGAGFLSDEQREALSARAYGILGRYNDFTWDNAFIVRKEAEFALKQLGE